MLSFGQGVLILGGTWSKSAEFMFEGSQKLLDGETPRLENSCAVETNRDSVIITGGKGGHAYRRQTWELSLVTGNWKRLPDIPDFGRYQHSCAFIYQVYQRFLKI